MKKFALVVEYGTGKAAMLTEKIELEKGLEEFYTFLESTFPPNIFKDFLRPSVTSCEVVPVLYDISKDNSKKFILLLELKSRKYAMVTDTMEMLTALKQFIDLYKLDNPADSADITACRILYVIHDSKYGEN